MVIYVVKMVQFTFTLLRSYLNILNYGITTIPQYKTKQQQQQELLKSQQRNCPANTATHEW